MVKYVGLLKRSLLSYLTLNASTTIHSHSTLKKFPYITFLCSCQYFHHEMLEKKELNYIKINWSTVRISIHALFLTFFFLVIMCFFFGVCAFLLLASMCYIPTYRRRLLVARKHSSSSNKKNSCSFMKLSEI